MEKVFDNFYRRIENKFISLKMYVAESKTIDMKVGKEPDEFKLIAYQQFISELQHELNDLKFYIGRFKK